MVLKPIPVPGNSGPAEAAPSKDQAPAADFELRQAQAVQNWKSKEAEEAKKRQREEKAAAAKKAREKAQVCLCPSLYSRQSLTRDQRFALLEGKGLGELDGELDMDAKSWQKGQKKRIQKSRDQTGQQAAAEAPAATAKKHTADDLAGVQVGHSLSTLLDGDEQILTLKDSTVLENEDEGDELENIHLREEEKLKKNLELKRKKPIYDPTEDAKRLLPQYDDEVTKSGFTLDAGGTRTGLAGVAEANDPKQKLQALTLDILSEVPSLDYLDASEVKVKKPKKKKSKATRKRAVDDDDVLFPGADQEVDASEPMEVDTGGALFAKKRKAADESFVDDEDLQATLALQRLNALKKRKKTNPSDFAKQLRENGGDASDGPEEQPSGGLVLDEISEFVSAIKRTDDSEKDRSRSHKQAKQESTPALSDDDEDVAMADDSEEKGKSPDAEESTEWTAIGVDEEKTVSQGMGATLSILRGRGLLQEWHGTELNERFRKHQEFITMKNRTLRHIDEDARRHKARDRASLEHLSTREREEYLRKQNSSREYQTSKALQEMFNKDYTPNFEISYTDEYGACLPHNTYA